MKHPHDRTKAAVDNLLRNGKIKKTHLPRRRGPGEWPNKFYRLPNTPYRQLIPIMREKIDLSTFVAGVAAEMGRYAELVWFQAFKEYGWSIHPMSIEHYGSGINEWRGRKATVKNDVDFIAVKDGVEYAVEVKNGLAYPDDLYWKIRVAVELNLIPLLIVRWLNPVQQSLLRKLKIPMVIYKTSIYSIAYEQIVEKIKNTLGYPIEARDKIDQEYFQRKVEETHRRTIERIDEIRREMETLRKIIRKNNTLRKTLGDK